MTDLNKLRSEFEAVTDIYHCIYNADLDYYFSGSKFASDKAEIEVNAGWKSWKKAKAQAVPETQQKLTDTYYLEGSDYVVDCPFEYDIEIDKGEVLELQKWQRTESTKVYFANIYEDEDNFEILQFASKAEAENAVAENLKMLEASESGAEG
ncbi:hypothetical protein [Acinetobacter baumannii]|uniref:hypothetical protein n=3 Tax=Acinetobacter baumannii TaxID=470 RepID=UPI000DE7087A|nr:hypothetical protein [Acinetobacter baumannii]EHT1074067.1 hypothetical protein [Acinetobacter baumannii]EKW7504950.1 hypothetical protein [Acinetobacter baumannii]EMF0906979.1 hypothetical protein [Acinetobacter baumannii]MBF1851565.1 hypothetical protein [Acinetobacter baumannii]MBO0668367.1 hypothetical protein [Acinetobacter baumannii]